MKATAICIKYYQDQDDLELFEEGEITKDEIRTYNIGDEHQVFVEYYNPEYWKLK